MELDQIFPQVKQRAFNVTDIARRAGISRATYYQIIKSPERTSIFRLRSLARALGYKMTVSFEPLEGE
jgi:DNA-binding phage protein